MVWWWPGTVPRRMCRKEATYNTPIQTTVSYPIIGLTGLLNLVTVMDKFRPQAVAEKGCVCRPLSSPPAHRAQRAHPVVAAAARPASPTSPVAAQPAAGAPAERRSRAGGGQRCVCTTVWRRDSGTPRTFSHGTGSAEPSCTCANRRCHKSWRIRNPPACHRASCDGRSPGGGLRPACW